MLTSVGVLQRIVRVKRTRALLVVILIFVGVSLRAGNLNNFGPIADYEKGWIPVGYELTNQGIIQVWRDRRVAYYQKRAEEQDVILPYLEHPPVFALIIGNRIVQNDVDNLEGVKMQLIRVPMLVISAATMLIVYLYISEMCGWELALMVLAALVFFVTNVVVARFVVAEHLVGMFLVLGLYLYALLERARRGLKKRVLAWGLVLLCSLAVWVKLSALLIPMTLIFMAAYQRRYRLLGLMVTAVSLSVFLFIGYVVFWDWKLLLGILLEYGKQKSMFTNSWAYMVFMDIGNYKLLDPSMIVGAIGVIILATETKNKSLGLHLRAALMGVLLILLYQTPLLHFGWQRYLLHPLFSIGLGYVFWQLLKQKSGFLFLFLPLLGMVVEETKIVTLQASRRWLMIVLYGITLFPLLMKQRALPLKVVMSVLLVFLFASEAIWAGRLLGYW